MSFDEVDIPATDDEIDKWWSRLSTRLLGFTAAGHEGVDGMIHWMAVTENQAGYEELYRLCWTMNDNLPWKRTPGVDVNCMSCLTYAARPTWKDPS